MIEGERDLFLQIYANFQRVELKNNNVLKLSNQVNLAWGRDEPGLTPQQESPEFFAFMTSGME